MEEGIYRNMIKLTSNNGAGGLQLSNVSFVVSKVDSPAMIKKHVRIINNGKVDTIGRLEVKIDGKWHTIRKSDEIDKNASIAKAACK